MYIICPKMTRRAFGNYTLPTERQFVHPVGSSRGRLIGSGEPQYLHPEILFDRTLVPNSFNTARFDWFSWEDTPVCHIRDAHNLDTGQLYGLTAHKDSNVSLIAASAAAAQPLIGRALSQSERCAPCDFAVRSWANKLHKLPRWVSDRCTMSYLSTFLRLARNVTA